MIKLQLTFQSSRISYYFINKSDFFQGEDTIKYAFSFVRKSNPLITSRRTSIILPSKKAKQSLVQPLTVFHLSFIMDIKTEQGANLVVWFCSVATHRNGVSYFLFVCCSYYITPLESQSRLFSEFFPAQIDLV